MGGGTDLLVCIEEGIVAPRLVVDLRSTATGNAITSDSSGGVRISATARLHQLERDATVRERFAALAAACRAVGTPALRAMGTIGGNLCQRPRCWYFRRGIPCLKNGGGGCPAQDGENQYHAILDGGPCFIVHPSDPAVALTALGARVELVSVGSDGHRTLPIEDFYVLPRERIDQETVLRPGEVVSAVILDGHAAGGRQIYRKLMQRGAWDFALVSVAAVRREDGGVRVALGGVAPRPWRIPESVEEDIASGGLDEDSIVALAERALYDAQPLSKNGYKVALAASLLRDAMRDLTH
jgi:xanthine dehydrogenase YagS FAD-binding subunit